MKHSSEIEYLQNAANSIGLTIHEKYREDKRKTVKMYFAKRGQETVSPVLDYENLNHFLLGWIRCSEKTAAPSPNTGEQKVTFKVECLLNDVAHYTHDREEAYNTYQQFISDYEDGIRLYESPMPINDHDAPEWETIECYDKEEETANIEEGVEITGGEWGFNPDTINDYGFALIDGKKVPVFCTYSGHIGREQAKANAKAICTAVNETYGKGLNPAAMGELVEALQGLIKDIDTNHGIMPVSMRNTRAAAKAALLKAKLNTVS